VAARETAVHGSPQHPSASGREARMSKTQSGRSEQACGTAACTPDCCSHRQYSVLQPIVFTRINLLLPDAIPAALGERNTIRSHDLQMLGIGVDPASGFESTWVGEDGGIVVHPVCGH
jgi:hypothetical protein